MFGHLLVDRDPKFLSNAAFWKRNRDGSVTCRLADPWPTADRPAAGLHFWSCVRSFLSHISSPYDPSFPARKWAYMLLPFHQTTIHFNSQESINHTSQNFQEHILRIEITHFQSEWNKLKTEFHCINQTYEHLKHVFSKPITMQNEMGLIKEDQEWEINQ